MKFYRQGSFVAQQVELRPTPDRASRCCSRLHEYFVHAIGLTVGMGGPCGT